MKQDNIKQHLFLRYDNYNRETNFLNIMEKLLSCDKEHEPVKQEMLGTPSNILNF